MNDVVLWNVFELAVNVFQGFIFMFFCYKFLGSKFEDKKGLTCLAVASGAEIIAITSVNYFYEVFNGLEIYVLVFLQIIYCFTCLKGTVMSKIFVPVFSYCGTYGISASVAFLVSSISGVSMYELMASSSVYRFICMILINALYVVFYLLTLRFKHYKFNIMKWTDWTAFIVIPLLSIVILVLIYAISLETNHTREHSLFLGFVAIGILVITVLIWIMLIKISKDSEFELQYKLLQQQYKYQNENILQANKSMESISAIRHDMKNKLLVIGQFIKNGDMDNALKMCGACEDEVQQSAGTFINTKNSMLNAIVNVKLSQANEKYIDTQVFVTEAFEDVADTDLCIMLGNVLDNAVEAVAKLPEDNRRIKVAFERKGAYRSIVVKNTIEKSVLKSNPRLHTTKSDKAMHGIGTKSLEKTVKKYKGEVHFTEKDGLFCVDIVLPIPNLPK